MEIQWVTDKNGNDFYPATHQKAVIVDGSKTLDKKLSEMESDIGNKANPSSIPTNVSQLTNDSNYQTGAQVKSTVSNEVAKIVADAPENYDTLKEISDWISGHENDASAMNSAIKDNKSAIATLQTDKADKTEIPTELPANGGNSATVNGHTVKSDVPENAVFTDTVYDDAEVQKRISDNGYGEVAGGKNLVKSFANGTRSEPYYIALQANAKIKPSTQYTISFIGVTGHLVYLNENIFSYGSEGGVTCTGARQSVTTMTLNSLPSSQINDGDWIIFKNNVSNSIEPSFIDVQIEEGTTATSYEPYFPSNKMLAEEKADKSETTVNLLKPTLQTTTVNGITCTNNGDGTYTISGTCTEQTIIQLASNIEVKQNCVITGCKGGSAETYLFGIFDNNWFEVYDGENKEISANTYQYAYIAVRNGVTIPDNTIIKPMLTTNLSATYDDFVPYTGDSGSLNGDVADLREDFGNLVELGEDITD